LKTFTATELNKEPSKVFRAVDKDGMAFIQHDRYPEQTFVIRDETETMQSIVFCKDGGDNHICNANTGVCEYCGGNFKED